MGQKDLSEKILFDYNDVFADIINVLLFDGVEYIHSDELQDFAIRSQYKVDTNTLHEQERDIVKKWNKKNITFSILGIENQTVIDRNIPVRIIGYDGASYRSQLFQKEIQKEKGKQKTRRKQKIAPVVTIVLYFGERKWKTPVSLKEVLDDIPQEIEKYVNDYKVHIFNIAWLSEDVIRKFRSDFGIVAEFFVKKRKDKNYVPDNKQEMKHVDEILKLISVMTGDNEYQGLIQNPSMKGTVKNMCDVAQNLLRKGRSEGIKEGIKEGIQALVETLKEMGQSNEFIIDKIITKFSITEDEAKRYL